MKSNLFNIQIIGLLMLSLIPWPGPTVFRISCPRDSARIVRRIVQTKWTPVLNKYRVSVPLECPFHPDRDIFGPQQAAKHQHRHSQWTCGLCGKSFFEEKYLDLHFDNRHKNNINVAEDAVCLADYCDIMRCDVLIAQDPRISSLDDNTVNTDIEIWREASAYTKALTMAGPRDVARYTLRNTAFTRTAAGGGRHKGAADGNGKVRHCQKSEAPSNEEANTNGNNKSEAGCEKDLVDSALPSPDNKQQRIAELQKLKANCKPEDLQKIKTKCEILVRDCIASLLIKLSIKDFKEVEDELNRAVCWYLTCDRYWEDSATEIRSFPWGLLCMIIMVLSLGICLCYYIIWVLYDTDDVSVTDRSSPSPAHALHQRHLAAHTAAQRDRGDTYGTEADYYNALVAADKDNEYIYVTYPPDLKRRLLERYVYYSYREYSSRVLRISPRKLPDYEQTSI